MRIGYHLPGQVVNGPLKTGNTNACARMAQQPSGGDHMASSFEYKIIVSADDDDTDEQTLNDLGAQGWELVSAIADVRANEEETEDLEDEEGNIPVTVFYLKRETSR